jgi:hypothetical protein
MTGEGLPDIAVRTPARLSAEDLRFLAENFPAPAASYEEMTRVLAGMPSTLESLLEAEYVHQAIFEKRRELLQISPFLLFSVLVRRCLEGVRTPVERAVANYLANLLALFVRAERVHRPDAASPRDYRYFAELAAAAQSADERESFRIHAHIGNYALWLSGVLRDALEYAHRYRRRPVSPRYVADMGRAGFRDAASHRLAKAYGLEDVFLRLALRFDHYRERLNVLARDYLFD